MTSPLSSGKKNNGLLKFKPYLISSVEIITIESKKSKTIDLHNAYIYEKKFTGIYLID